MNGTPWLGYLLALLGGGAMGAIIKILFDWRQGQLQAVGQRLKIFPVFQHRNGPQSLTAVVAVTHEGSTTEYRNLFIADLTVINRGNKDYGEFEFGVSLHDGQCVHVAWENPDLHHILSVVEAVSPAAPKSGLKFRVNPFNRTDAYSLRLYLTSGKDGQEPELPQLSSPYPIRFIDESDRLTRRDLLLSSPRIVVVLGLFAIMATQLGYAWGKVLKHGARWIEQRFKLSGSTSRDTLLESSTLPAKI